MINVDTLAGQASLIVLATLALLLAGYAVALRRERQREARWARRAARRSGTHPAGRTARYAGTRQVWTREH